MELPLKTLDIQTGDRCSQMESKGEENLASRSQGAWGSGHEQVPAAKAPMAQHTCQAPTSHPHDLRDVDGVRPFHDHV